MPQSSSQKQQSYEEKLNLIMGTKLVTKTVACYMARNMSWKAIAKELASGVVWKQVKLQDLRDAMQIRETPEN